ncbi:MAG: hypothetical protein FWE27_01110 [Defluviitaleaceae bacterium]|nr:hypothetical protein [Defluviitaleaceae bacterium]
MEQELRDEISRLKSELRTMDRELKKQVRAKTFIENNLNVRMNMFRALANENEKYRRFLNQMMKNSVDFLLLLDGALNVAYYSEVFLRNFQPEQVAGIEGKNIIDVYQLFTCGEVFEQLQNGIDEAINSSKTVRVDIVIGSGDSQRFYRVINTPILDEQVLCGFLIDWSDMTDIINAKNEAESASKSKSDFLATV